jgi:hypothetical protein
MLSACSNSPTVKMWEDNVINHQHPIITPLSIIATPITLVADVMTLGGNIDDEIAIKAVQSGVDTAVTSGAAAGHAVKQSSSPYSSSLNNSLSSNEGSNSSISNVSTTMSHNSSAYAPLTDPSCAKYSTTQGSGSLYGHVTNTCNIPIQFLWCWIPNGAANCTPNSLSDTIAPGQTDEISGPSEQYQPRASYLVCNMSGENATKLCTMKSPVR